MAMASSSKTVTSPERKKMGGTSINSMGCDPRRVDSAAPQKDYEVWRCQR